MKLHEIKGGYDHLDGVYSKINQAASDLGISLTSAIRKRAMHHLENANYDVHPDMDATDKAAMKIVRAIAGKVDEGKKVTDAELIDRLNDKANGADDVVLDGKEYVRTGPKNSTSQPGPWRLKESQLEEGKKNHFARLNKLAKERFGEFGIATCSEDEMAELIDIKAANKYAEEDYGEFGFATLSEDDMKELINAHPDLIKA